MPDTSLPMTAGVPVTRENLREFVRFRVIRGGSWGETDQFCRLCLDDGTDMPKFLIEDEAEGLWIPLAALVGIERTPDAEPVARGSGTCPADRGGAREDCAAFPACACTTAPMTRDRLISDFITNVMELPDRTSPDDWPAAMLITGEELDPMLRQFVEAIDARAERLLAALNKAATQFEFYAEQHAAKAQVNRDMAAMCRAAIADDAKEQG